MFYKRKMPSELSQNVDLEVKNLKHNGKLAVGGIFLTVAYIIFGMFLFFYLEDCLGKKSDDNRIIRTKLLEFYRNTATIQNTTNEQVDQFVRDLVKLHSSKSHNSGCQVNRKSMSKWLEFSVATIHTIGYGKIVPKTTAAKVVIVFFSLIGIPLALFQYIFLSHSILCMIRLCIKLTEIQILGKRKVAHLKLKVFVVTLFFFLLVLISASTITSHTALESSTWLDNFYFWWVAISTIGYGDHTFNFQDYTDHNPTYIVVFFFMILIGIAMVITTLSAIWDYFTANNESVSKSRKNTNKFSFFCCCCSKFGNQNNTVSDDIELDECMSFSDATTFNRNSFSSFGSGSYISMKPSQEVIENGNRMDSQRSTRIFSDIEKTDDEEDRKPTSKKGKHKRNRRPPSTEQLQTSVSPKMVTAAVASKRSSKL